jgi:hypothetical protein
MIGLWNTPLKGRKDNLQVAESSCKAYIWKSRKNVYYIKNILKSKVAKLTELENKQKVGRNILLKRIYRRQHRKRCSI